MIIISPDLIYQSLLTKTFGTDHVTSACISPPHDHIRRNRTPKTLSKNSRLRLLTTVEYIQPSTAPSALGIEDIGVHGVRARSFIPKHEKSEHQPQFILFNGSVARCGGY